MRPGSNASLRVAMLIDTWFPFFGGGQVHVKQLRRLLSQHYQVETELFYASFPNLMSRFFWAILVVIQVYLHHRHKPFVLIHSHGFIAGLPGKILSVILNVPVIHTVHGSHLMDKGEGGVKAQLERWLLTRIKYSAQISVAQMFLKYDNVNNVTVIPNGVIVRDFDKVRVRKNRQPTLIWVGRDHPDKGLNILKEALIKARRKIPILKAELVSGGRLVGKQLVTIYKKAHVFVLPSLAEGQPITLLEAWAAKLPVIVTPVGDNTFMVRNGINGVLVEPGNVSQLAKAILRVFRNKRRFKQMGINGYRLVKRRYSWQRATRETYRVYRSLLQ
ncbi:hypothetical protein A3A66_00660 [Microgenomates group bacterium RIFCSPLOWO2_01_FULL_46_13]|nr:MAG: hypothetical protein A2783_02735 [Microgenomates group bacterium RIFCSPHIGHO2_01_FULL_45_11]OGV94521.1 MAG: hypothetical protein A3A66_00660 [Microgenomates group bacterium RIFCSPLOWO2_01_FULL_46_13]